MGGDFRQVGGDFLAKALDPEGPPPAQETLAGLACFLGILVKISPRLTLHARFFLTLHDWSTKLSTGLKRK